jgi:hypothetical protein
LLAVKNERSAQGICGYLTDNLKAQARLPRQTSIGYLAAWTSWASILLNFFFIKV